ncbi:MAG: J domain-containing protein [Polyangiaceae bacterium]|nr:J domain-containing protein [Polyangiaceae bacterium]
MADLYEELGVPRTATQDEIKKAYKKLAAKLHPDRNPGDKRAEARFKAVNRAHQVLADEAKRKLYDEFGEDGLREGFDPDLLRRARRGGGGGRSRGRAASFDFEDLLRQRAARGGNGGGFGDLFGDLFGGARGPAGGSDVASEVTVDFVSAIRGATLELRLQDGSDPIQVRVPPGAGEGDRIRLKGHGAPGAAGGPPGDLLVTIHVTPHPHYERDGLDLSVEVPITVGEAWRGAKIRVPTPEGEVTLVVPERAQSGQRVRLKGKGVRRKSQVGDLYVRFLVQLPAAHGDALDRAIDTLEQAWASDVRADLRL